MWRNKDWMALDIGGKITDGPTYLTSGYTIENYALLSNIEIIGGTLVGKDIALSFGTLTNKFDPFSFDYTVVVPSSQTSIDIIPKAMSSRYTSLTVNGIAVTSKNPTTVNLFLGVNIIQIVVVAPDGTTTNTYTLTVTK